MSNKPNLALASRRDFLFRAGEGIGGLALAYLLNQDGLLAAADARTFPA